MIEGIIFDYGGTLDTPARHWSEVLWEGYQYANVPITKEQFLPAYVLAEQELARIPHILPSDTFYQLLYKKVTIELRNLIKEGCLPDSEKTDNYTKQVAQYCDDVARHQVAESKKVLEQLAKRYPLVLVTNFYGNITSVLKEYGICHLFISIVESAVVGVRKPSPEIFKKGVEALNLPSEQVLVVGDSYSKDISPALQAGCQAIWFKGDSWQGKEEKIEYERTISSLNELLFL